MLNQLEGLSYTIKEYLKTNGQYPISKKILSGDEIISSCNTIIDVLNQPTSIFRQADKYKLELANAETNLKADSIKLNDLVKHENQILKEIDEIDKKNDELGIPIFNALIQQKLLNTDDVQINRYKNYIPDNIPWKNDEIPDFEFSASEFLKTFSISAITSLSVKRCISIDG